MALVLALLLGTGLAAFAPQEGSSPAAQEGPSISALLGTAFAGGMPSVRQHVGQYGTCVAMAPVDWIIYAERREGDVFVIGTPGGTHATYRSIGVPGGVAMTMPDRYATPDTYVQQFLWSSYRQPVSFGQPSRDAFGYTWVPYDVGVNRGVVFYQVWRLPNDPLGYILVMRSVSAERSTWERQGAQALAVALSIRCAAQLRPPSGGGVGPAAGDDDVESEYNQQLGMEYAHDPATGENYWVSPGADWNDDGPEGPGYYKRSGGELKKLDSGRSR